jgi:hypothetical protein
MKDGPKVQTETFIAPNKAACRLAKISIACHSTDATKNSIGPKAVYVETHVR